MLSEDFAHRAPQPAQHIVDAPTLLCRESQLNAAQPTLTSRHTCRPLLSGRVRNERGD